MAARSKDDVSRWLMKNRSGSTSNQAGTSNASSKTTSPANSPKAHAKTRLFERLMADEAEDQRKRSFEVKRLRAEAQTSHREGIDFDEIFDDDDGGWEGEEEANAPEEDSSKKSNYRLSSEGRLVKRIVKHLDKDNDIIYASDEEDEDDDEDDLGFEDLKEPAEPPRQTTSSQAASSASRITTPQVSRATSPAGSPQKATTAATGNKKAKSAIIVNENQITEAELVGYLRQGPLSTKELIAKFKRQLKADPKNKDIFRDLVRKVAMVKASGTSAGEEDKLLELKPEYK